MAAPDDHSASFIDQTLARMAEAQPADIDLLARLWFHLRPHANQPLDAAHANLAALLLLLQQQPVYVAALRDHLIALFVNKKATRLLTDAGLLPDRTFGVELRRRIGFKLLPPKQDASRLRDWLDTLLSPRDQAWVCATEPEVWTRLCDLLQMRQLFLQGRPGVLTNAINILSHRIAVGGVNAELLRLDPVLEEYNSPFLALHHEVDAWLRGQVDDARQIDVLLDQCSETLDRVRRRSAELGTSIDLTLLSTRLAQQMSRLRKLVALADPATESPHTVLSALLVELIEASGERYSVSGLVRDTTGRLARQITQFASQTGELYLAEGWPALRKMFWAASGAGVIIAAMALLKARVMALHLAPLQEALVVSLNYALGFVLIYVLHLTIATKQSAMTASLFAHTLAEVRGHTAQQKLLNEFADKVWRSQSVAILGNMLFAFATAVLIALALGATGVAAADPAKAAKLLDEIDPLRSAALFYAAVAGVGLFLSGIVSGYYDNKTVYQHIPERLLCLEWPQRLLGRSTWQAITDYLHHHLGGIMGNVFFGFYLGLVSAFGQLAGLPLDVRHIAFAAANLGFALPVLDWQLALPVVLVSIAGVVLIGLVNLAVSFSLAFYLALRATRTSLHESRHLLRRGLFAILKAPFHRASPRSNI